MGRIFRFGSPVQEQEMQIVGMPGTFWVVTKPTANSELGDCCFESTFRKFALQARGGLDVEEIVGIYVDEQVATAAATKLLEARRTQ